MPRNDEKHLTMMGGDATIDMRMTDTALGNMMISRMGALGIKNLRELEVALVSQHGEGISHGHLRRLVRGLCKASVYKLKLLAKTLKVPYVEVYEASQLDDLRKKFRPIFHKITKRDPRFERFERLLPYLDDAQLDMMYKQGKNFQEFNAAQSQHPSHPVRKRG